MPLVQNMTESELIDACLEGDRRAQQQLYDRYSRAMYTLAYQITGDFDLANDVLQDAFIQVFRYLDRFRRESTLGAWIKRIVVRMAVRTAKKRRPFEPVEQLDFFHRTNQHHGFEAERLEQAILSLPTGYRMVFILIEVEGYSHRETSTILGISEGTSKSQLYYAKKKLRKILADESYGA